MQFQKPVSVYYVYSIVILEQKFLCLTLSIKAKEKGRSGQSSEKVSEVQS